ncbi:MAG: hypothetical protein M3178_05305 [Pseudomonadota bacterium]|nr:hypothetical protein [Pseudomonadota bacterium]
MAAYLVFGAKDILACLTSEKFMVRGLSPLAHAHVAASPALVPLTQIQCFPWPQVVESVHEQESPPPKPVAVQSAKDGPLDKKTTNASEAKTFNVSIATSPFERSAE